LTTLLWLAVGLVGLLKVAEVAREVMLLVRDFLLLLVFPIRLPLVREALLSELRVEIAYGVMRQIQLLLLVVEVGDLRLIQPQPQPLPVEV
jgi:hypothetical protein